MRRNHKAWTFFVFMTLAIVVSAFRAIPLTANEFSLPAGSAGEPAALSDSSTIQANTPPPVKKLGDNRFQIGRLVVDANIDEIYINGEVNMSEGMIELLACAPRGKTHESVLVLDVDPVHLQIALLLLGLEARGNLEYQGDPNTPDGDSVDVYVEWNDPESGELFRVRGEELIYDINRERPMEVTAWVFTGSRIIDGVFMAAVDGSLITTYHDPNTIIDNPLATGGDDTVYRVNEEMVPIEGTDVKVTIKPCGMKSGKAKKD